MHKNALGKSNKELADLFNKRFKTNRSEVAISSIKYRCSIYGGKPGWSSSFLKPEYVPWSKGKRIFIPKGKRAPASLPKGTERETTSGYIIVKAFYNRQPTRKNWIQKHKLIYERAHGKIPKNCIITFLDGDKRNFDIDNLMCITKKERGMINRQRLISTNTDWNKIAIGVVRLKLAINKRIKETDTKHDNRNPC